MSFLVFMFFDLNIWVCRLPRLLSSKESACQCRRRRKRGFNPWISKIPWRRKWQPIPLFLPEKSHGQSSLTVYSPWGRKELDMTEQLSMHTSGYLHTYRKSLICRKNMDHSFLSLIFHPHLLSSLLCT